MLATDLVSDLSGKVVLVTGATSGIGLEAARVFARRHAKLIMACIEKGKMAAVADMFKEETADADIVQMHIDLGNLESVHEFVRRFKEMEVPKIDVLLLNAGVAETNTFRASPQGFERTFATNHLGHWLLTGLLIDYMKDIPDSRIISVSSMAHTFVKSINYTAASGDDPSQYSPNSTYAQTKLANQLFVTKLNQKLVEAQAETIAVVAHPGVSQTALFDGKDISLFSRFLLFIFTFIAQPAADGALPLLMAATDPDITRDSYYGPRYFGEHRGPPFAHAKKSKAATDRKKADQLWGVSEQLCGFTYPI